MAGDRISGPEKAALFLLGVGEELASQIVKQLEEDEVRKLGSFMAKLPSVSPKVLDSVFSEFHERATSKQPLQIAHEGGAKYIRSILSKALEGEKAQALLQEIEEEGKINLFQRVKRLNPRTLANFLRNEHPQTIAIILAHLDTQQTAATLSELPNPLQTEVVYRMTELGNVAPDILEELDETLQKELATLEGAESRQVGGVRTVAEILNQMDSATESAILKGIEEHKQGLADEIRQLMFVFEDFLNVDDRGLMAVLKEVNNETLRVALKTASDALKEKIFRNMSERAAQMMKEDMEVMGPVRLKDVEAAQQTIIRIAKKLESEGKLILSGKGKEDAFV